MRGDTDRDIRPRESATATLACIIDTDFRSRRWDADEWEMLKTLGVGGVVMDRIPEMIAVLAPDATQSPICRAVVEPAAASKAATLKDLHQAGIRGVRYRLHSAADASAILHEADRFVSWNWHIELGLPASETALLHQAEWMLMRLPVPLCFTGLFDFVRPDRSIDSDLALLLAFIHTGRFWLKLSASDLLCAEPVRREMILNIARQAVAARPDRLVWGSGSTDANASGNVGRALQELRHRFADPQVQEHILLANPAALYDFC